MKVAMLLEMMEKSSFNLLNHSSTPIHQQTNKKKDKDANTPTKTNKVLNHKTTSSLKSNL
jgi:hypothetical protein